MQGRNIMKIENIDDYKKAIDELFRIELVGYENHEEEYINKLIKKIQKFENEKLKE
jgi:hypothetical protein